MKRNLSHLETFLLAEIFESLVPMAVLCKFRLEFLYLIPIFLTETSGASRNVYLNVAISLPESSLSACKARYKTRYSISYTISVVISFMK